MPSSFYKLFFSLMLALLLLWSLFFLIIVPIAPWPWPLWFTLELIAFLGLLATINHQSSNTQLNTPNLWSLPFVALILELGIIVCGSSQSTDLRLIFIETIHISQWTLLAFSIFLSIQFLQPAPIRKTRIVILLMILAIHIFLLLLAHDFFAARSQIIFCLCLCLCHRQHTRLRLSLFILSILYFVTEKLFIDSLLYSLFKPYNWLDPSLNQAEVAYGMILRLLTIKVSGFWGLGSEFLSQVDLLKPGDLSLNALPYLTIWLGSCGTLVLAIILLTLLTILLYFTYKYLSGWKYHLALAIWFLITINQFSSFLMPFGNLSLSNTHGLAFMGSGETGLEMIILVWFILKSGFSYSPSPENKFSKNI